MLRRSIHRRVNGDCHTRAMTTYEADDSPARLDVDAIYGFLSTQAYWHRWRTRAQIEQQIRGAWRVVGIYIGGTNDLVGYARAMSDGVSDAYLGDVYVLRDHRGQGLGKLLMRTMVDDGPGKNLRWFLTTKDAHGLYRQFGFAEPDERMMVRPGNFPAPTGEQTPDSLAE
jgi:GNAT superfamily N-acetyltransferase